MAASGAGPSDPGEIVFLSREPLTDSDREPIYTNDSDIFTVETLLELGVPDDFMKALEFAFEPVRIGSDAVTANEEKAHALQRIGYEIGPEKDESVEVDPEEADSVELDPVEVENEVKVVTRFLGRQLPVVLDYRDAVQEILENDEFEGDRDEVVANMMSELNRFLWKQMSVDSIGQGDMTSLPGMVGRTIRSVWRQHDPGFDRWGSMTVPQLRGVISKITRLACTEEGRDRWYGVYAESFRVQPDPFQFQAITEMEYPAGETPADGLGILVHALQEHLPDGRFVLEFPEGVARSNGDLEGVIAYCDSEEMVAMIRERFPDVNAVIGDTQRLPFKKDSISIVVDPHEGSFVYDNRVPHKDELDFFLDEPELGCFQDDQHDYEVARRRYVAGLLEKMRVMGPNQGMVLSLRLDHGDHGYPRRWPMDVIRGEIVMFPREIERIMDAMGLEIEAAYPGMGMDNMLIRWENKKKAEEVIRRASEQYEEIPTAEQVREASSQFSSGTVRSAHEKVFRLLGRELVSAYLKPRTWRRFMQELVKPWLPRRVVGRPDRVILIVKKRHDAADYRVEEWDGEGESAFDAEVERVISALD